MNGINCLLILILIGAVQCEFGKLLSVVVLYRHGCRSPVLMYRNDPYLNISSRMWPDGLGQLTNIGKNQQYELGKWLRQRYNHFIPEHYNNKFIKIISSDSERTIMSANANLAGLFPPKGRQIWNKNLPWQPIPVHTIAEQEDNLLMFKKPCLMYEKLRNQYRTSQEYKEFFGRRLDIVRYVSKHSGENMLDLDLMTAFHDTLSIESSYGLSLPAWTYKVYPDETLPFAVFNFAAYTATPALARLRIGPLLNHITSFFENVITNPNNSQKILMLSAHDNTIVHLLDALGLYDRSWPETSSMVFFELGSRKNEEHINIYLKNSTIIRKLKLGNCLFDCNFRRFKKLTKPVRINRKIWEKECLNQQFYFT